jgi:hypothetical protein
MKDLNLIILAAVVLAGLLLRLLIPKRNSPKTNTSPYPPDANEPLPTAKHYTYFPQIRRALSSSDAEYLLKSAPPKVAKQALRERRAVARRFLGGLHEDFSNLARLGRVIAALSPEVSHKQETERLLLTLKFQVLYAVVWVRLATGSLPLQQLEHLTDLVGRLARRMDEAMAEISAIAAGQLGTPRSPLQI